MVANEAEGRAEALRRIAACRTAQAEELDLGGLQLTALDGELLAALCQLGWLRRLFLGLSAGTREEPQLASIYFASKYGWKNSKVCNALGALPGALFDALTRLERLDLSLNRLRGLPAAIAKLTALTSLNLADNGIGAEGAQALKGLVNLTSLTLPATASGMRGRRRSRASSTSPASTWGTTTSGPRGRRRSRASSISPASTCPATASGTSPRSFHCEICARSICRVATSIVTCRHSGCFRH
jgi:hypothetical protein